VANNLKGIGRMKEHKLWIAGNAFGILLFVYLSSWGWAPEGGLTWTTEISAAYISRLLFMNDEEDSGEDEVSLINICLI
jgi:hypothetical protein